jgi:hypothetical protein
MNNPQSFTLGWAAFYAAGIGGAYLGYRQYQTEHAVRVVENEEHTRKRNELLDQMEERLRKEGKLMFKARKVVTPDSSKGNVEQNKSDGSNVKNDPKG